MDSDDDASTTSTRGSKSPMTTENEMETEEEKKGSMDANDRRSNEKHKRASEEMKMNLIQHYNKPWHTFWIHCT